MRESESHRTLRYTSRMSSVAHAAPDVSVKPAVAMPTAGESWSAVLELAYARVGSRTVPTERMHSGPLRVQKALYPEGPGVCQHIIVHPPGGIVGGDTLAIRARADCDSFVQFTTPGATKWYGSAGGQARQSVLISAARGAAIEWFPREAIVFDGAIATVGTVVELEGDAVFIGSDIVCLGRTAASEIYARGSWRQQMHVSRDGAPVFIERARIDGGGDVLKSLVGLNGAPVYGTFYAASQTIGDDLLATCREVAAARNEGEDECVVTRLPGLLVARYRGASTESAHAYFVELWRQIRPALLGRDALLPRIWNT